MHGQVPSQRTVDTLFKIVIEDGLECPNLCLPHGLDSKGAKILSLEGGTVVFTSRGCGTEMERRLSGAVWRETQTVGINRMRQIFKHVQAETAHMELTESGLRDDASAMHFG